MVGHVVDGLVTRICIGLPGACAALNDEAATEMYDRLMSVHSAISLLQNEDHNRSWQAVLKQLAGQEVASLPVMDDGDWARGTNPNTRYPSPITQSPYHGLISGRACRLLMDAGTLTPGEAARQMGLALSTASEPAQAAAWVEGFLKGSGLALLHDDELWAVMDEWVSGLRADAFTAVLPLLRRTFATFPAPERRQMGERVKHGPTHGSISRMDGAADFDVERAEAVLPLISKILGIASNA
jgi:hypothetical protein